MTPAYWFGDPTNSNNCCVGGPMASTRPPGHIPDLFVRLRDKQHLPGCDTVIMAHEAADGMNDPYDVNPTPVWGHVGQGEHMRAYETARMTRSVAA